MIIIENRVLVELIFLDVMEVIDVNDFICLFILIRSFIFIKYVIIIKIGRLIINSVKIVV